MKILSKKLLLLSFIGLAWGGTNAFAACTSNPDCATLGYTMTTTECSGLPTIKCPFDTSKIFCDKVLPITCTVGSAIYGDGKCYDIYSAPSNVKPVGVVFDATKRLAIALNAVKKDGSAGAEGMQWMSTGCDLTGLSNCSNYKTCWTDGSTNMLSLSKKCTGSCTCNAINAAKLYQPTGCSATFCSKGKWFIPSMLEMETYYNSSAVKDTLQQLTNMGYAQAGSNQIPQNWFTLSTSIDSYGMMWGIWSDQVMQSAHIVTVPVWPVVKY